MVQAELIYISELGWLKNTALPGILTPSQLNMKVLNRVSAVIVDDTVSLRDFNNIETMCHEANVPLFRTEAEESIPEHVEDLYSLPPFRFLLRQHALLKKAKVFSENLNEIRLQTVIDIITTANSILTPKDVMKSVMNEIGQLIKCEAWSVLIIDQTKPTHLSFEAASGPISEQLKKQTIPLGQGVAGWVAEKGEPVLVHDPKEDSRFFNSIDKANEFNTRNLLCAPLVSRGRVIGVIEMINRVEADSFSEKDLEIVQVLVNPAAVAIENAYLFQKAERLSVQDDLTGLYNSRHLNFCLDSEIRRASRHNESLSLLFLDLDFFKRVNDNYGHMQGSQSLIDVAQILRHTCRETDIMGRYGGDEFVVILPATGETGAKRIGERIRDGIEHYQDGRLQITVSIGIATYPKCATTRDELVTLADKAMYYVKENGKNGVALASSIR